MFDPLQLYGFVESRVRMGRLVPQAFFRLSRIARVCGVRAQPHEKRQQARLRVRSISFGQAAAFAAVHHRHLDAPAGHVFSLGVFADNRLCGVAIVGRPVSRCLDDGNTLEVTRVATDGTPNACSALYGAARREAARKGGIARLVTYTLAAERGTSLRAAGFLLDGAAGGGRWSRRGRPRRDLHPTEAKQRWSSAVVARANTNSPSGARRTNQ